MYKMLNFGGVAADNPLLFWSFLVPPKIRVFIWLLSKNRILTKTNLNKRGWRGFQTCVFCSHIETVNHLFLECQFVKQIWFWMGQCQSHFLDWHNMNDIRKFALSLPTDQRTAFLTVFCAICWTVWKHRNEISFQNMQPKSARNVILLIMSLVLYWTSEQYTQEIQEEIAGRDLQVDANC